MKKVHSANGFSEFIISNVLKAYLIDSKSHRKIQGEILGLDAPAHGGGYVAMQILHDYGVHGYKKGILTRNSLADEYQKAQGPYKIALELLRRVL